MVHFRDGRPDKNDPPTFDAPANIVFRSVDASTGNVLPPSSAAFSRRPICSIISFLAGAFQASRFAMSWGLDSINS